jgi:uncharacterized protein YndB with AHSA1/START domain
MPLAAWETDADPPDGMWLAVAIGLVVAVVLYAGGYALERSYMPAIFAIPFFFGVVVGLFSLRHPYRNAFITLVAAALLAVGTMREGVICLLYSLPILVPELFIGAACGHVLRRWARSRRRRAQVTGGLVLLALAWQAIEGRLDDPARHPVQAAEASVVIAAPPERVFAALTARELTVPARWPWFLRVGLPMPRSLRIDAPGPAGRLRVEFSSGTARGHVTAWRPPSALAFTIDGYEIADEPFHITRLGRGPHYGLHPDRVDDWLTLVELAYTLERTPDGGTRLARRTTWRRHLAPGFYFAPLQQAVIGRGQARLLELVKERVERGSPRGEPETAQAVTLVADTWRRQSEGMGP